MILKNALISGMKWLKKINFDNQNYSPIQLSITILNTCFTDYATGNRKTFHLSADRMVSYNKKLTWVTSARWWNGKPQAPILPWRHQINNIRTKMPWKPSGNQLRSHSTLDKPMATKRCIQMDGKTCDTYFSHLAQCDIMGRKLPIPAFSSGGKEK